MRAVEGLLVAQCEAECIHRRAGTDRAVAADQPTQIAGAVFSILSDTPAEGAGTHQLIVERQVRTTSPAALRTRDEFPAALGQEPVV